MLKKILAVDDNSTDLVVLERLLRKRKDFKVIPCCGGEEALELLKTQKIDLVLIDALMPVLDGYEACQIIKEMLPQLPIIIVTGLSDDKSIKRAFEVGAFDYLTKPIRYIELISRIDKALKISSSEKQILDMYSDILEDLAVAHRIQTQFLPSWFKLFKDFYVASIYRPKDRVSGDVYDVFRLTDDKYFIYVGDISGHGVQAAFLMTAVQTTVRILVNAYSDNFSGVDFINELCNQIERFTPDSSYLTAIAGVINTSTRTFSYLSAGHPPLVIYNIKTGKVTPAKEKSSLPIGLYTKSEFTFDDINTLKIDDNSIYILYTDGIFECTDKDDKELEFKRFIEELSCIKVSSTLNPLHNKLMHNLIRKNYSFQDDVTFLSFQFINRTKDIQYFEFTHTLSTIESLTDKIIDFIKLKLNSDNFTNKVELATTEIITNIVMHGFNESMLKVNIKVLIVAEWNDANLVLTFYDKGKSWNYEEVLNKVNIIDIYSESGRGWEIICKLTSKISINRFHKLNETKLTFTPEKDDFI